MKRYCIRCGMEIAEYLLRANTQYCSSSCQKMAWNERTKILQEQEERTCGMCGIRFQTKPGKKNIQIYCSPRCNVARQNFLKKHLRRYRGRKQFSDEIVQAECERCGKTFLRGKEETIQIKFCSTKCKNANHHATVRPKWNQRKGSKWDGNWAKARIRDQYKCMVCGDSIPTRLLVHHLDGSGESDTQNHDLENLTTVCGSCHSLFHHLHLLKINGKWEVSGKILKMLGINVSVC